MTYQHSKEQYQNLFPTDKEKAAAFDQIAEHYYMCNFGSMSKADFDIRVHGFDKICYTECSCSE